MPKTIVIGGKAYEFPTEEEQRERWLGTEEMGRIMREVLLGEPAPENERPLAAAFRKKFTEQDLPVLKRIPGATVFTPE